MMDEKRLLSYNWYHQWPGIPAQITDFYLRSEPGDPGVSQQYPGHSRFSPMPPLILNDGPWSVNKHCTNII